MNTSTIAMLLVCLCEVSSAQEYVIKRESRGDIFVIPRSLCKADATAQQCNGMGANQKFNGSIPADCTCQCDMDKTHNVFGFFDNTWKCESNSAVRKHGPHAEECLFLNKTKTQGPLVVVPQKSTIYVGFYILNCKLQDWFSYLDCSGTWRQMDHASTGFSLSKTLLNYYYLKDKGNASFGLYNPTLYGRVIKLNIKCYNHYCILLKVFGQLKCPVKIHSTISSISTVSFSSPPPRPSSPSSPLSSSSVQTTTSALVSTSSHYSSQPPSTSTSSTQHSLTPSLSPVQHISTEVEIQSTKTKKPFVKNDEESGRAADHTIIIAGAVVGVVALLAIAVMILLILKIRRKRKLVIGTTGQGQSEGVYAQPIDNNMVNTGQQSSSEDQYDYAYAAVNKTVPGKMVSNTNNQASDHFPPVSEAPVYNTLEDPDYVKPEPVYNVLEGPENETNDYDVVEETISSDAPEYHVLEGPGEEQHVYSSLQAQEPHLYCPLNPADIVNRDLNRGYENNLYNSNVEVIPLSEKSHFSTIK